MVDGSKFKLINGRKSKMATAHNNLEDVALMDQVIVCKDLELKFLK